MPPEKNDTVADSAVPVPDITSQNVSVEDVNLSVSSTKIGFSFSDIPQALSHGLDQFQRRMCVFFVNRPGRVFGIGSVFMLLIAFLAAQKMQLSEGTDYDWLISTSIESDHIDIRTDILNRVDFADGAAEKSVPVLSENFNRIGLQIMYEPNKEGEDVFTPESVQAICEVESVLWNLEEFQNNFCVKTSDKTNMMPGTKSNCSIPELSLTPYFYEWQKNESRECTLLSTKSVEDIEAYLFKNIEADPRIKFFFNSKDQSKLVRARSLLPFGGPLKGYTSMNDRRSEQMKLYNEFAEVWEPKLWDKFGLEMTFIRSAYRNDAVIGPLRAKFYSETLNNLEFDRIVNSDLMWTLLAMAFVFGYITFHTGSFFLAYVGVLQILLSLPISFFFYYYIFQITFYSQLHILVIFLVLGVGADNIFVLVDSWKLYQKDPEFNKDTFTTMLPSYKRASAAIFNTSLTTAMAFISTSISPIMPIGTFGIYAALAILVNYLYVIFFLPSVMMLQYYYFSKGWCFWKTERPLYQTITWQEAQKVDMEELNAVKEHRINSNTAEEDVSKLGFAQRFFQGPYTRFITSRSGAIATVLIFTAIMIQGIYFGLKLVPPTESEKWFSDDHMWTGLLDTLSKDFLSGPDNAYTAGSLTWGVTGIDRSMFDKYSPGENRGTALFKKDFDISSNETHQVLLEACKSLRTKKCDSVGCMDSSGMLVRKGSVKCWIEEMQTYYNGTLPLGDSFLEKLKEFRKDDAYAQYAPMIGLVNGELKYVSIDFKYTLESRQPMDSVLNVKAVVKEIVDDLNKKAPESLGDTFPVAGIWFTWIQTEEGLVNGMYLGFAICFPVAFLVLFLATGGNLLIAAYATTTIVGIVATVLGVCQSVLDWDLGVAESIAAVIVVGFSVDYVCHLSHPYAHSASPYRKERTAESARTMATTVAAGGMTTLGAGLCMFGCQMVFFTKMAVLISLTIVLSLGYSLGFFMALCALCGPEGKVKVDKMPTKEKEGTSDA